MSKFISNLIRNAINEAVDKTITRMARDSYTENLFEWIPVTKKEGLINMIENVMRATQGKPPERPWGSHLHFSPWEKLLFNPVHLYRFPTQEDVKISTSVTIGKGAKKPLKVSIPLMIAGMSFGGALSKNAKIALAKGASMAGTATNTGEAGLMEEEREAATLLIGQYNRGGWLNTPDKYSRLDAIEIQLGQGAQGSTAQRTVASKIGQEYREVFGLAEGEDAVAHTRLPGVNNTKQFIELVRRLRDETNVPVGLKIAATHYLEKELQVALEAGVDFITIDGAEAGSHAAAPILEDDLGLPTLYAVSRASKYLSQKGAVNTSLIAAGGLSNPGQYLKAMALGADVVYIGTAAITALLGEQMTKTAPFEPPSDLVIYNGKITDQLDVERSSIQLANFLKASVREMESICYTTGKVSLSELSRTDLCTLDPFLSRAIGVELGYISSDEQNDFFAGFPNLPDFSSSFKQDDLYHDQHELH
ncbi:FMN-binding glutamate synthase family protein [Bacillus sp. JJ1533]|uniref:FMN-binding glutamate synthase family protein n=1 Tax=Bacillus sp. JJ1533 TaxID=3122959 RepID=UPI00300042FA